MPYLVGHCPFCTRWLCSSPILKVDVAFGGLVGTFLKVHSVGSWDSSWMWQTQNNKLSQMTYQKWRVTVLSTYYICEFRKGLVIPLPLKSYSALSNKLHGTTHGGDAQDPKPRFYRQFDPLSPRQARWSGDRPANFQDLQQLGTAMVIVGKPANKNTSDLPEMSGTSTISQRKAWCLPHWNYSCWSTEFWSQPQLQPNTVIACNCQLKNH